MAYEFAKQLLERADSFELRQKAIRVALRLGMPLQEIEQYLDWLDNQVPPESKSDDQKPQWHIRSRRKDVKKPE